MGYATAFGHDWGEDFQNAPEWCIAFARWLVLPKDLRDDDEKTIVAWSMKHDVARQWCAQVQHEPEFKRLRLFVSDENGVSAAHRQEVFEHLYRMATTSENPAWVRMFMEASGQILPRTASEIDEKELPDSALDLQLAARHRVIDVPARPKENPQ